jgi:serine phosphatase RsbU (regulator of sigma subunit)
MGGLAALLAALSILDMALPKPYDGVVLESDRPGKLFVRRVLADSGAERAGIQSGDEIVGIARSAVRSISHAGALLQRQAIGEKVPYLVRRQGKVLEVTVELGPRRIGTRSYVAAVILGASFLLVGVFVLRQQPKLGASQVFFVLCCLFLLFLVCRLRPASYSRADQFVLGTGTAALALLPACFLHFFSIFPRPLWEPRPGLPAPLAWSRASCRRLLFGAYVIPPLLLLGATFAPHVTGRSMAVISGAPVANWWLLAIYVPLGLVALAANARVLPSSNERRGARLVLVGALLGLVPFLGVLLWRNDWLGTDRFILAALLPLALVPLTFAYAIVRYRLFDVRLILRKSLLYTATTALVTGVYALAIASFNTFFRGSTFATSPYFPVIFALAIVLLFEPLRRQVQGPIDRFFFADRSRLQSALIEMGEAFNARLDPAGVVRDLVEELPRILGLRFAALYLLRSEDFERVAGPSSLPSRIPLLQGFYRQVQSYTSLTRLEDLTTLRLSTPAVRHLVESLAEQGVEVLGDLASTRRRIGLVLLSGRTGGAMPLEEEELRLLRGLLHQAAIAIETSQLLEERARQAELERELEIAAEIQRYLLPETVELGPGYRVAAVCKPARHVGGDFYAEIAGPDAASGARALVYGDVAGKSVSGALLMMAAKEALHSLALGQRDPEELLASANQRIYELASRSFVALGYLTPCAGGLRYSVAGQPAPIVCSADGSARSVPLPAHRLPLGAMTRGRHQLLEIALVPGEVLLAFSDGVIEAHSPNGELFGDERLLTALAEAARRCRAQGAPGNPQTVLDTVLEALERFTAGAEPYDDVTLLAVARLGPPSEPSVLAPVTKEHTGR